MAKEVEMLCEPYRTAQTLVDTYDRSLAELTGISFAELLQTERYVHNIASAKQSTLIPVLEVQKVGFNGMASVLMMAAKAIDTSWMSMQPSWMVKASELLAVDISGIEHSGIIILLALEQVACNPKMDNIALPELNVNHNPPTKRNKIMAAGISNIFLPPDVFHKRNRPAANRMRS